VFTSAQRTATHHPWPHVRPGHRSFLLPSFSELGVPRDLIDVLADGGVTEPFPVQAATIAEALAGRDLCGRAPTGSGKTLAFAIPLAARAGKAALKRPRALVLAPTRELAAQITATLRPLAERRGRSVATFYGGTSIPADQRRLRSGVDIAVACPGRLADLVNRRDISLADVDLVVLDEADRMADMGFLPEVRRLLDRTSPTRQTLLFSATLDGDVDVLTTRYQRDPVRVELAQPAEERGDVRHVFWGAEVADRVRITGDLVHQLAPAIVFTRTKHGADRVAKQLVKRGVSAAAIHGDRSQNQRERALADFTAGRVGTLVATDVAARGIHVDDVALVVHFDPPASDKDYVHRSGRTGRAGAEGVVVTLVAPDKRKDVAVLQRALRMPAGLDPVAVDALAAGAVGTAGAATPRIADRATATHAPRAAAGPRPDRSARSGSPRSDRSPRGSDRSSRGGRPRSITADPADRGGRRRSR